jgi:hypothetical protein
MRVPLGGDDGKPLLTVQVDSSDGITVYVVRCLPGGLWTCTCPGFVHRTRCRHIMQVRKRYVEDAPDAADRL